MLTHIEATVKEPDITIIALIHTGSKVSLFRNLLLPRWEKLSSDKRIKIKGVHLTPTYLNLIQSIVWMRLGNKILKIPLLL